MKRDWDIFCAVVDNFGDIGVCWRLARQLAAEHGLRVRLWVDDLAPLSRLCPEAKGDGSVQMVQGVQVRRWDKDFPVVAPAQVVIEAFACELPESYLVAMAAQEEKPLWINLEYLSAEPWVEGCHRMTSPHPRLPLTKHFFFPGFTPKTGGLLRERDYDKRRASFDPAAFRRELGLPAAQAESLTVSLFAYENAGLPDLFSAWAAGGQAIECLLPEGRLLPQALAFFGESAGRTFQRGSLTVHVLPFLPQPDYDRLLWLCDLNFVRGEDSFVRAQWAAKPLIWHIYSQEDLHHRIKLKAFLERYLAGLAPVAARALENFWIAWEAQAHCGPAWPALLAAWPQLRRHAETWAEELAARQDLTAELVSFSMESR